MSEYPSGNALRDAALLQVIAAAQRDGEPITVANISLHCRQEFGDSFTDVGEQELAEAVAYMTPPADEPTAETAEAIGAALDAVVGRQHLEPEREPPTMSRPEAEAMVQEAQRNLYDARRALNDTVTAQKAARGTLAAAVMQWQRGGAPQPTREELQRQHIASEQQQKLERANARGPANMPSAYDMGRGSANGGSVNRRYTPTRRGLLPGQKAFSLADSIARSGSGTVDLKGRAAIKPPSER